MSTFAIRGFKGPTFHGAHSAKAIVFKGQWLAQGPQPVSDDGGVPQWAADLFDKMPHLTQIALNSERGGVVWSRMGGQDAAPQQEAKE